MPTSYATTGSGTDWGTAVNWTPTGPPAVGSLVTVNHPMTVATGTFVDIGASVSAQTCLTINAALTVADGGSLTLRGNVLQRNSGSFIGTGAGRIIFDSTLASPTSTTWSWTLGDAISIPSTCSVTITGTSTSRFRVSSAAGGGNGIFATFSTTGGGTLSATYCDFVRIGDATTRAWYPNSSSGAWGTILHNCVFWRCGALNYDTQISTQPLDINACVFTEGVDTAAGADIIAYITGAPNAGVTWQITGCDFGDFLDLIASPSITVSGNTYRTAPKIDGTLAAASTPPYVATNVALTGPSTGGSNQASSNFTVALHPTNTTVATAVTVTPQVTGLTGAFTPTFVGLTTGAPSTTFTFTPTAQGTALLTLTNNGTLPGGNGPLLTPDPLAYTVTAAGATSYALTGPTSGMVSVASSNFTVAPNGTYTGTITPHTSGSGTFAPTSLTWSGTGTAQTFTYTPSSSAGSPHSISTTSSPQLGTNPTAIAYTVVTTATSYTLTGPTAGVVGVASSAFVVIPNGTYTGTITPHTSGSGTFTPTSLSWSGSSTAQTFTYTPSSSAGSPHSISTTSSPQLGTDPTAIAYTVNAAASSYATNGAGTDWGTAANWTPTGPPAVGSVVTVNSPMTIATGTAVDLGASIPSQACLTINSSLTISDGASLTIRGDVIQAAPVTGLSAGKILFDSTAASPTTTTWAWRIGTTTVHPVLTITGSSTKRFSIKSKLGGGNGYFTFIDASGNYVFGNGSVNFTNCDLVRIGDATNPAVNTNYESTAPSVSINHCVFDHCGLIYATNAWDHTAGSTFTLTNNVFRTSVGQVGGTVTQISDYFYAALSGDIFVITGNDFQDLFEYYPTGFTINTNVLRAGALTLPDYTHLSATPGPYVPTGLTLTGPSGGSTTITSTPFTVALDPTGTTPTGGTVTVTPQVSGVSGVFSPTTVPLTAAAPSNTFTFTPSTSGTASITLTSDASMPYTDGPLFTPDPLAYVVSAGAGATSYTLTGPTSGVVGVASSNFTITPNGTYTGTITPHTSGSGTFAPTSLTWSGTGTAQTFTYTPSSSAGSPHSISTTSSPQLGTDPTAIAYTVASTATSYTLTGPTSGIINVASGNFTVTPNGPYTGTITITPSGGGLSSPIILTFSSSSTPQNFTITPTSLGSVSLTPTNSGALTNPPPLTYTVNAAPPSYATNGAGTDWGTAANWTPAGPPPVGSLVTVNHPMTIGSTTAVILGSSVIGQTCLTINAALTVASGGQLTVRGNVVQANAAAVTLVGASLVQFDSTLASPITTNWTWQIGTTPITTSGTSNNARARIKSVLNGGSGYFLGPTGGTGGVNLAYCDLIRIGDINNYAFSPNYNSGAPTFRMDHCNLYQVGLLNAYAGYSATGGSFSFTNCVSIAPPTFIQGVPTQLLNYFANAAVTFPTGPWAITGNDFDAELLYYSAGFTVSGNVTRNASYDYTTFTRTDQTPAPPYPVTYLQLSGPFGGAPNTDSGQFRVTATGGTTASAFTVTPVVSGITGSFSALSPATLATGALSSIFTFHPTAAGIAQITFTNTGVMPSGNGTLFFPDAFPYRSTTVATFYAVTAPMFPTVANRPSFPFTASIPTGMTLAPTVITPSDNGAGGSFVPSSVTLSTATISVTFQYVAVVNTQVTLTFTNNGGLTNPPAIYYTSHRSFDQAKYAFDQQIFGHYLDQAAGGDRYVTNFAEPPNGALSQDTFQIYDPLRVYLEIGDYLGASAPPWLPQAIAAAFYQNHDLYFYSHGGAAQPYYTFDVGLRKHWEQYGDVDSFIALAQFYFMSMATDHAGYDQSTNWVLGREGSYAAQIALNAERIGIPHWLIADIWPGWMLLWVATQISNPDNLAGITNPCGADYRCIACIMYLVGITARVLIDYYERYKHNPSTTVINPATWTGQPGPPFATSFTTSPAQNIANIPGAIKAALDYCQIYNKPFDNITWPHATRAWFPEYLQYPYWDRSTAPMDVTGIYGAICSPGMAPFQRYDGPNQPIPNPVLNSYISHANAWYALHSGDINYIQRYEESFAGEAATAAYTGARTIESQKEFNEGYGTGAFRGLRFRDRFFNPWPLATAYTLAVTDAASGQANRFSGRFTIKLVGSNVALTNPVIVTPSDGGVGGTFLPATTVLMTDEPLACFRYAPPASAAGTNVTISVTNDGGLTNPGPVSYGVTTVAPFATGISLSVPTTANGPNEYSPDYTFSLFPNGSVPPRFFDVDCGVVLIRVNSSAGWTMPQFCVALSQDRPSATLQIWPGGLNTVTLTIFNAADWPSAWTFPTPPAYTPINSNSGLGYTLKGPSSGSIGSPVPISVSALSDNYGTFTVTFTDGVGGTFNPPTVAFNNRYRSGTVMYTPHAGGVRSIGVSNSGPSGSTPLVNPAALTFVAGDPFVFDSGTVAEQTVLAVQARATDGGTATEGLVNVPSARIVGLDSGAGTESALNRASFWIADLTAFATDVTTTFSTLFGSDPSSWSEFGPAIAATFSQVETGTATDVSTPPVVTAVSNEFVAVDAGAGLDYPLGVGFAITAILAPIADSAASSDLVGVLGNSFGAVDTTFTFLESSNLTVTLVGTDLGVGAESVMSNSALRTTDVTAQVSEVLGTTTAAVTISDLFSWSESAPSLVGVFPAVDSGALKDVSRTPVAGIDVVVTSSVDSGVMAEPIGLYSSTLRSFDPGVGSDGASTLRLNLGVVDSGTSADVTGSFTPSKVATDSGAWTDSGGDGSGYIGTSITTKIGPPAANARRHKFFPGMFRR